MMLVIVAVGVADAGQGFLSGKCVALRAFHLRSGGRMFAVLDSALKLIYGEGFVMEPVGNIHEA